MTKREEMMNRAGKYAQMRRRHAREERQLLRQALRDAGWVLPPAALSLGIGVSTLAFLVKRDEDLEAERIEKRPAVSAKKTGRPAA